MRNTILLLRWRFGLLVGALLKRVGSAVSDAGWRIVDHSARRWYPGDEIAYPAGYPASLDG